MLMIPVENQRIMSDPELCEQDTGAMEKPDRKQASASQLETKGDKPASPRGLFSRLVLEPSIISHDQIFSERCMTGFLVLVHLKVK